MTLKVSTATGTIYMLYNTSFLVTAGFSCFSFTIDIFIISFIFITKVERKNRLEQAQAMTSDQNRQQMD